MFLLQKNERGRACISVFMYLFMFVCIYVCKYLCIVYVCMHAFNTFMYLYVSGGDADEGSN